MQIKTFQLKVPVIKPQGRGKKRTTARPASWPPAMKWMLLVLLALLALLQYRFWFAPGGMLNLWSLQEKVEQQSRENDRLSARNAILKAEVMDLKSGDSAIEERARTELGMIREGETFFIVVDDSSGQ